MCKHIYIIPVFWFILSTPVVANDQPVLNKLDILKKVDQGFNLCLQEMQHIEWYHRYRQEMLKDVKTKIDVQYDLGRIPSIKQSSFLAKSLDSLCCEIFMDSVFPAEEDDQFLLARMLFQGKAQWLSDYVVERLIYTIRKAQLIEPLILPEKERNEIHHQIEFFKVRFLFIATRHCRTIPPSLVKETVDNLFFDLEQSPIKVTNLHGKYLYSNQELLAIKKELNHLADIQKDVSNNASDLFGDERPPTSIVVNEKVLERRMKTLLQDFFMPLKHHICEHYELKVKSKIQLPEMPDSLIYLSKKFNRLNMATTQF